MIRTKEQIELWLKEYREQKQRQQQKIKDRLNKLKEQEKERRKKHIKLQQELQRQQEEKQTTNIHIDLKIYGTKYIERYSQENSLYLTREELKEAEERNEGKINWTLWNKLINERQN